MKPPRQAGPASQLPARQRRLSVCLRRSARMAADSIFIPRAANVACWPISDLEVRPASVRKAWNSGRCHRPATGRVFKTGSKYFEHQNGNSEFRKRGDGSAPSPLLVSLYVRARMPCTVDACHLPPRAVAIPRTFSASAISLCVRAPAR